MVFLHSRYYVFSLTVLFLGSSCSLPALLIFSKTLPLTRVENNGCVTLELSVAEAQLHY